MKNTNKKAEILYYILFAILILIISLGIEIIIMNYVEYLHEVDDLFKQSSASLCLYSR